MTNATTAGGRAYSMSCLAFESVRTDLALGGVVWWPTKLALSVRASERVLGFNFNLVAPIYLCGLCFRPSTRCNRTDTTDNFFSSDSNYETFNFFYK